MKFSAYQANISAYTVALLSWKSGGCIDFERIWSQQAISKELRAMLDAWVVNLDKQLRRTAGSRTVSEWAKKAECWEALRDVPLELPERFPSNFRCSARAPRRGKRPGKATDGLSRDDLELIERCRRIDAATWFKVAQWGVTSKAFHWKVAGIAKTVGEYAIGGWERSPSAKQAKMGDGGLQDGGESRRPG